MGCTWTSPGRGAGGTPIRSTRAAREEPRGPELGELIRPHARAVSAGAALSLLQAGAALALPASAGLLAASLAGSAGPAPASAGLALAAMVALLALHAALGTAGRSLLGRAEAAAAAELRQRLLGRLQRLPLAEAERLDGGRWLPLFSVDAEAVAGAAVRLPAAALPLALTGIGAVALMARLDPWTTAAVAVLAPALAAASRRFGRPAAARSAALADSHGGLFAALRDSLEQRLTVKVFAAEAREADRVGEAGEAHRAARVAHLDHQLRFGAVVQLLGAGGAAALVALAALRPGAPAATTGELVTLLLYGGVAARAAVGAAQLHLALREARAAQDRIARASLSAVGGAAPPARRPGRLRGALCLHDVTAGYAGRPPVLRQLSLRVEAGEWVALVGSNGAGKTTLLHLLPRLLDPSEGAVRVDGADVRALDPDALRRQIGLVPQHVELFGRSLRENVAYGRPDADRAALEEAAWRAGAEALVCGLPDGWDTPLGERGLRLSGGQRQRLALARALLLDPPILLLDEATAALDADAERRFLERNRAWLRERTVLWVTHRPAHLALADRVVELRDGAAVERTARRATGPARATVPVPAAVRGALG